MFFSNSYFYIIQMSVASFFQIWHLKSFSFPVSKLFPTEGKKNITVHLIECISFKKILVLSASTNLNF